MINLNGSKFLWQDNMPKRAVDYDADKCNIVGSGVKYTAREKDFIFHIHKNLLKIWDADKDSKPATFIKFFEQATGITYRTWLRLNKQLQSSDDDDNLKSMYRL